MNVTNLKPEQIISLVLMLRTVGYIELIDYDAIDWLEWERIHRN